MTKMKYLLNTANILFVKHGSTESVRENSILCPIPYLETTEYQVVRDPKKRQDYTAIIINDIVVLHNLMPFY